MIGNSFKSNVFTIVLFLKWFLFPVAFFQILFVFFVCVEWGAGTGVQCWFATRLQCTVAQHPVKSIINAIPLEMDIINTILHYTDGLLIVQSDRSPCFIKGRGGVWVKFASAIMWRQHFRLLLLLDNLFNHTTSKAKTSHRNVSRATVIRRASLADVNVNSSVYIILC